MFSSGYYVKIKFSPLSEQNERIPNVPLHLASLCWDICLKIAECGVSSSTSCKSSALKFLVEDR